MLQMGESSISASPNKKRIIYGFFAACVWWLLDFIFDPLKYVVDEWVLDVNLFQ
jgi:hypothetical protein